jgi:hypothetical protein
MRWRKSTWAVIGWTALAVVWLAFSVSATAASCQASGAPAGDCGGYVGLAVVVIASIWLAGVALLLVIWFATRREVGGGDERWGGHDDRPAG